MCTLKWPPAYVRSLELFNSGEYWLAHEALEELWRATEDAHRRLFYQAIIQLAAAFVHLDRGNLAGGASLLRKAHAKLATCPTSYLGLRTDRLRFEVERSIVAADTGSVFDWSLTPLLTLDEG